MIHGRNRMNYHQIVPIECGGWTFHRLNLGGGCISPVLRASHNLSSHSALMDCVSRKLVGTLMAHVLASGARAFVLQLIDALNREFRKCFQISVAVDFARFDSEDVLSFVELVQREVGKETELEPTDRHGSHRYHDLLPCCFSCKPTVIDEDWHVSATVIYSKAIWFRRKLIQRGRPSIGTSSGTCSAGPSASG